MWSLPLGLIEIYGQHVELHDLALIGLLVVLEGLLSVDNALVLGLLAKRLPKDQQAKALTYGLVGAFIFRFIAIALATLLLHWRIVKFLGGAYLVYVSLKHFIFEQSESAAPQRADLPALPDAPAAGAGMKARPLASFWPTVVVIELTDIAFAVDSILAAIALVGGPPAGHPADALHPKLWVVFTGGMLGVILMRFAAAIFIRLLERFPRFEASAYLLVLVIGIKLLADWHFNVRPPGLTGQQWEPPLDFHSPSSWAFWVFWILMLACFVFGFLPGRRAKAPNGRTPGAG